MKTLPVTLATCAALTATAAHSQDANSPFSAEFEAELQSDFTVDSSAPDGEINNTFATIEGALSFAFSSRTSINSTLVLEQITAPTSDSFLEDHGLYAEELYFAHDFGAAQVVLGKFNPAFGTAWDVAPVSMALTSQRITKSLKRLVQASCFPLPLVEASTS